MRIVDRVPALALAMSMAVGCAHAERGSAAAEWSTVTDDSARLVSLVSRSREVAGPEVLRVVLQTAADSSRPTAVRLHALAVATGYLLPGSQDGVMGLFQDTSSFPSLLRSMHADYTASSSIEPVLRDSIRLAVRAIARTARDPMVRRAATNLAFVAGSVLGERSATGECPEPAAGGAPDGMPRFRDRGGLRDCPQPLMDEWLRVGEDSTRLNAVYVATQRLRDRRIPPVLSAVSGDVTRPREVRWAALQALATLAHPRMFAISLRPVEVGDEGWCIRWSWHAHHAVQEEGAQPMGPEGRAVVRRMLRQEAEANPDALLRRGAAGLGACIDRLMTKHPTPRLGGAGSAGPVSPPIAWWSWAPHYIAVHIAYS